MKKYLLTISALMLLVAACEMFPPDTSIAPETVSAPSISISQPASPDSDSTFSATITPSEGTGFYSYVVIESPKRTLNAESLLKCNVDGAVSVNYATSPTATFTLSGLTPNTKYYVYAVASSTQGIVTQVSVDSVTTTDNLTPRPLQYSFSADGKTCTISFNEPVRKSGNGSALLTVYAVNAPADSVTLKIPEENVSVSDSKMTVTVPDPIPGSYVNITWESGYLVNMVGTSNPGYTRRGFNANDPSKSAGITARITATSWNLDYELRKNADGDTTYYAADSTFLFTDYREFIANFTPDSVIYAAEGKIRVTYTSTDGTVLSYNTEYYGMDSNNTLLVGLERAATPGDCIEFTIPKGIFEDKYGNTNAEFTTNKGNMKCSYGYSLKDITGSYDAYGQSYFDGNMYYLTEGKGHYVVIEALDKVKEVEELKCNVSIKNLAQDGTIVYGAFDVDAGTLTVQDSQFLYTDEEDKVDVYFVNALEYSPVVFNMTQKGFISTEDWFGYNVDGTSSYYNVFIYTELVAANVSSASAVSKPASVSEFSKNIYQFDRSKK